MITPQEAVHNSVFKRMTKEQTDDYLTIMKEVERVSLDGNYTRVDLDEIGLQTESQIHIYNVLLELGWNIFATYHDPHNNPKSFVVSW